MRKYLLLFLLLFAGDTALAHGPAGEVSGWAFGSLQSKVLFAVVFFIFLGIVMTITGRRKK